MGDARQMAVFTGGIILLLCLHAQWEQMLHSLKKKPFYKIAWYQYYQFWCYLYMYFMWCHMCVYCVYVSEMCMCPEAPFLIVFPCEE